MQRAAGTAGVYGISMERLIGYTGAIAQISRESGSVIGNSLKSIASRITSVEGAVTALNSVGISVKNSANEMKKVDDILDELGAQWHSLSAEQQQNIGIQVAGRYQLSRFLILMNQYKTALEMTATAENSAGSGIRENEQYLKSYEAKINSVKNAWVETVVSMRDSGLGDAMTGGLSAGISGLNTLTAIIDKVGVLPVVLGAGGTAMMLLSGRAKAAGTVINTAFVSSLLKIPPASNSARVSSLLTGTAFDTIAAKSKLASVSVGVLRATLSTILPIAGIMAVGWAIGKLVTHTDEAKQKLEEFKAQNTSVAGAFTENESKIKNLSLQYSSLSNAISDTSLTEQERNVHAKNLIGVQNELADLLPVLKQGEDEYGNSIIVSSEAVGARISLLEQQAEAEKKVKEIQNVKDDKEIIDLASTEIEQSLAEQEKYYGKLTAMATEYSKSTGKLKIVDDEDIVNAENKLATAQKALEQFREARNKALADGDTKTVAKLDGVIQKYTDVLNNVQATEASIATSTYAAIQSQLNLVQNSIKSIDGVNKVGTSVVSAFSTVAGTVGASSQTVNKFFDDIRKEINSNGALNDFVLAYQQAFKDYISAKKELSEGKIDDSQLKGFVDTLEESAKIVQDEISKIANQKGIDGENLFGFDESQLAKLESGMGSLINTFAEGKLSTDMLKDALNLSDVQAAELLAMIEESADGVGEGMEEAAEGVYELKTALDVLSGVSEQQLIDVDELVWMFEEYKNRLENATVGTFEHTQAQAEMIAVQEQLANLYPHLIDLGDQSISSIMAQIDAVRQEVEAQDILRAAMKASRDGKLTADEDRAKSGLETARVEINNINEQIKALNKLAQAYAELAGRAAASADDLASKGFDAEAEDAYIRAQKFAGFSREKINSIGLYDAQLSELNKTQRSYIDELKQSEAVMGNVVTQGNKNLAQQQKDAKAKDKANKSQKKLNDTTKKAIYLADSYAEALRKIDLEMSKLNETKERYNEWDKEHIAALKEEMALLEGKKALIQSEASSLNDQITSGNHTQTGVVTYDTGSTSGAYTGKYAAEINKAAKTYNIDPFLIAAVIKAESNFNPNAGSGKGARGLMQLMPATARGLGVTNVLNPEQNIMGGTKYLAQQLKAFGNDIRMALAAYNAGPGNVKKYGGIPPFKETQNYVNKVTADYAKTGKSGVNQATTQAVQSAVSQSMSDYYLKGNFRANQGIQKRTGKNGSYLHTGLDLITKSGTDIKSVKSGVVKSKGKHATAGNYIDIKQEDGTVARYLHMKDQSTLQVGATVKAGDSVGKVGSTGRSSTPHLHLEIRDPSKKAAAGDLSPNYGLALDPRKYLQNQVTPVQMSSSGGGKTGGTQGQAEAQYLSEGDKLKADLNKASQDLLQINSQIREQRKKIWNAETSTFRDNKMKTDENLQNSDNRLKKHDSSSKEYRDELEVQKLQLKNKQKYNQQEVNYWKKVQKDPKLDNVEKEYVRAKLHELGLEKNVIKFEIDDKSWAKLESLTGSFSDRRDKLGKEFEFEQTKLKTLTHDSEQYYKTLDKISSLTDRELAIDQEELKAWQEAVKSGELYGERLKEAKNNITALKNSVAELKVVQQENMLMILSERQTGFENRRGKIGREEEFEQEKLKTLTKGSDQYYKTLEKISSLTDRNLKISEEELVVWEEAIKSGKLYGETLTAAKVNLESIRNNVQALKNEQLDNKMFILGAKSEVFDERRGRLSRELEFEEAKLQGLEEGSERYFKTLEKINTLTERDITVDTEELKMWQEAIDSGELYGEALKEAKFKAEELRNSLMGLNNSLRDNQERFAQAKFNINDKKIDEVQDKIDFLSYKLSLLGEEDVELKVGLWLEMQNSYGDSVNSIEDAISETIMLRQKAIESGNNTDLYDNKIDEYVSSRRNQLSEMNNIYKNMQSTVEEAKNKIGEAESKAYEEASKAIDNVIKESEKNLQRFSDVIDNLNYKLSTLQESDFDKKGVNYTSQITESKKLASAIISEYDRVASTPVYNEEQQEKLASKLRDLKSQLKSVNSQIIENTKNLERNYFDKIISGANKAFGEIDRLTNKLNKHMQIIDNGFLSGKSKDMLKFTDELLIGRDLDLSSLIDDPLETKETLMSIQDIRGSSYGSQIDEAESFYEKMKEMEEKFRKTLIEETEKYEKNLKLIMEASKRNKDKIEKDDKDSTIKTTKEMTEEEKKILVSHYEDIQNAMMQAMEMYQSEYSDVWGKIVDELQAKASKIQEIVAEINKSTSSASPKPPSISSTSGTKTDVKKYAKGTGKGSHKGGMALVSDGVGSNSGSELIKLPNGQYFLSPKNPTYMDLPKGSEVLSAKDTNNLFDIPKYAYGTGGRVYNPSWEGFDIGKIQGEDFGNGLFVSALQEMTSTIKDLSETEKNLSEDSVNQIDKLSTLIKLLDDPRYVTSKDSIINSILENTKNVTGELSTQYSKDLLSLQSRLNEAKNNSGNTQSPSPDKRPSTDGQGRPIKDEWYDVARNETFGIGTSMAWAKTIFQNVDSVIDMVEKQLQNGRGDEAASVLDNALLVLKDNYWSKEEKDKLEYAKNNIGNLSYSNFELWSDKLLDSVEKGFTSTISKGNVVTDETGALKYEDLILDGQVIKGASLTKEDIAELIKSNREDQFTVDHEGNAYKTGKSQIYYDRLKVEENQSAIDRLNQIIRNPVDNTEDVKAKREQFVKDRDAELSRIESLQDSLLEASDAGDMEQVSSLSKDISDSYKALKNREKNLIYEENADLARQKETIAKETVATLKETLKSTNLTEETQKAYKDEIAKLESLISDSIIEQQNIANQKIEFEQSLRAEVLEGLQKEKELSEYIYDIAKETVPYDFSKTVSALEDTLQKAESFKSVLESQKNEIIQQMNSLEVGSLEWEALSKLVEEYDGKIKDSVKSEISLRRKLFDERIAQIENISKKNQESINKEKDILENSLELIRGFNPFDFTNTIPALEMLYENSVKTTQELERQLSVWKEQIKGLDEYSSEWDIVNSKIIEAEGNIRQSLLTQQKLQKDLVKENFDKQLRAIELELFNGKTEEEAQKALDKKYKLQDLYVDGLEKELEVESIIAYARKAEIKLTEDELKLLNSKDKIEKKSLERLQKQLEIRELENRLANLTMEKNIQQLKKNEDGTWEYEYVVDQNAIDEAEQALRDKKLDLIKFEEDEARNAEREDLEAKSEYLSDMKKIVDKVLNGEITDFKQFSDKLSQLNTDFLSGMKEENRGSWETLFTDMSGYVDSMTSSFEKYVNDMTVLAKQAEDALERLKLAKEEANKVPDTPAKPDAPAGSGIYIKTSSGKIYTEEEFSNLSAVEKSNILLKESPVLGKNGKEIPIKDLTGMTDKELEEKFGLATGGYTGKNEGLAFLHEKELILNKNDSKNFLDALNITRGLSEMLDVNRFKSLISSGVPVKEQHFTIQSVDFPNIKSANGIEGAFRGLDTAVQVRTRKN